jgi:hypothetical protein
MQMLVEWMNWLGQFNISTKSVGIMGSVGIALCPLASRAGVEGKSCDRLVGMYQVTVSNDPAFSFQADSEWFLDFGKGTSTGKSSGSVAISLRKNPNVKVRIMAWEYFPKQRSLTIGNPFHEGSKEAVAFGSWQLLPASDGILLERGAYQTSLHLLDIDKYSN